MASASYSGADPAWNLVRTRYVEFCVWALLYDGLQAPPWVHHPAGNGTLRALGLDQASWREWLAYTVARYRESQARLAYPLKDQNQARDLHRQGDTFLDFWPAEAPIRAELARWWTKYRPVNLPEPLFQGPTYSYSYRQSQPNAVGITQVSTVGLAQGVPRGKRRWNPGGPSGWAPRKVLRELGALHLFVVRYPVPVTYLLPPDTVIVGSPSGDLRGRALAKLAVRAARDLSARHRRVRE